MVAPRSTNGRPFAVSPFSAASSPRSHRRGRSSCGGFTLVFVAVMLFVFFCLEALVIDMGFVRLTQGQMLSNVNTAAREGLRSARRPALGKFANELDFGSEFLASRRSKQPVGRSHYARPAGCNSAVGSRQRRHLALQPGGEFDSFRSGPIWRRSGSAIYGKLRR